MEARHRDLPCYGLYYGGGWHEPAAAGYFGSLDPYAQVDWANFAEAGAEDVDRAVSAAREAFDSGPWSRLPGKERGALLRRLAEILRHDAEALALIEQRDNGKLLREVTGQWKALPDWFDYFAGLADKLTGKTIPSDRDNLFLYTRLEPLGVVAAITPWNSPVALLAFKLAPAFAAGCTVVVKPSEHAPASVLELARRIEEAGFPPGVFNVVTGRAETGSALVEHPLVDKIAFTGSNAVGARIASAAGARLTRVALELGGKSPNIVFQDADLRSAVNGIVGGIFAATGQTCVAGARLLVQESVHDELLELLAARARRIVLGDPAAASTEMGPIANIPQFERVKGMVERALKDGAEAEIGGRPASLGGLFYEPTILRGVTRDMEIYREEVFGPVLCVLPFRDEEEAIELANDTIYGLAAGVWSQNIHRAHRVAHRVRAGMVWVNCYRLNAYYSPFGGFKKSGWGRENGPDAVNEYLDTKTVWVELSGAISDPIAAS